MWGSISTYIKEYGFKVLMEYLRRAFTYFCVRVEDEFASIPLLEECAATVRYVCSKIYMRDFELLASQILFISTFTIWVNISMEVDRSSLKNVIMIMLCQPQRLGAVLPFHQMIQKHWISDLIATKAYQASFSSGYNIEYVVNQLQVSMSTNNCKRLYWCPFLIASGNSIREFDIDRTDEIQTQAY